MNKSALEKVITLNRGVRGTLVRPVTEVLVPGVLLLHGFGSYKDEVGNLYKTLAAELSEKHVITLRFDFWGWGESAGDMADSTIDTMIEDVESAYNYLSTLNGIDPTQVGIVGFSLGGAIAILSAARHPDWFKSMVLWSSVGNLKKDFLNSLGQENFNNALQDGVVTIDLGWRTVRLKQVFFSSLENHQVIPSLTNFTGALLTIAGSEDYSAAYVQSLVESAAGGPKEAFIVDGADHIFNVFDQGYTFANVVLQKTTNWLSHTLLVSMEKN